MVPKRHRPATPVLCLLALMTGVLLAAGCGAADEAASEIAVSWEVRPDPPEMGQLMVAVTLVDSTGQPVQTARVQLEGTMTHPGMRPVLAEAQEVTPGRYEAALNLTMGGDWTLLLHATLPDGRLVQRQKEVRGVRAP